VKTSRRKLVRHRMPKAKESNSSLRDLARRAEHDQRVIDKIKASIDSSNNGKTLSVGQVRRAVIASAAVKAAAKSA